MKQHPLLRHLIQMRRLGYFTPVTTKVIPRDVIGDKKNKLGCLPSKVANKNMELKKM